MKKMKQFLAVLLVLALMVSPLISQNGMYEVQAEEESVETTVEDVSDNEKVSEGEALEEEEATPEVEKPQEAATKLPERESKKGDQSSPIQPKEVPGRASKAKAEAPAKETANNDFKVENLAITKDASNITAPDTFDIELTVSGNLRDTIDYVYIHYSCEETAKNFEVSTNENTISSLSGPEVSKYTISDVELNEYFATGTYRPDVITIQMNGWSNYVTYYQNENGQLVCEQNGVILDYNGEADFTVSSSAQVDNEIPEIISVKRVTEAPIYSNTFVEYEVQIKEEVSGVSRLDLDFVKENADTTEDITVYSLRGVDIAAGTKSVIVSSDRGFDPDDYQLYSMQIVDRADNFSYYEVSKTDETKFICEKGEGENNPFVTVADNKFRVEMPKPTSPLVTGLRWVDGVDSQNVAAGDKLEAILTIKNPTDKKMRIEPETCHVFWEMSSLGDVEEAKGQVLQGETISLDPEETYDMSFELQVSEYTLTGIRKISGISLNGYTDTGAIVNTYYYKSAENQLMANNMEGVAVDTIPYNGELDFNVTKAPNPDMEAPIIESITVVEDSLKAPGPITFKIKTSGEEVAPLTALHMQAEGESGYELYFNYEMGYEGEGVELSYSEEEGCYIYKQVLDPLALVETYTIDTVHITDEAGNDRNYYDRDGEILDDEGNPLPESKFTVAESSAPDTDTTHPILKNVTAKTVEVAPNQEFQVDIQAEEENGLDGVILTYVLPDKDSSSGRTNWMNIESKQIEKNEDIYTCTFKMNPYAKAGEYLLWSIEMLDSSCRQNQVYYSYDDEIGEFINYSTYEPTGVDTVGLTILPTEDYVISGIDEVTDKVEEVEEKGTIVVTGVDTYDTPALPQEFIEKAIEKELTVVVPDMNGISEIRVNAKDLSPGTAYSLAIVAITDWPDVEDIVVGGEKHDLVMPLNIMTSDKSIPATIRVKLDDRFVESCGGKGITLSRNGAFGELEVIAENLIPDEDGYVEVSLSSGWTDVVKAKLLDLFGVGNEPERMEFYVSAKSDTGEEPVTVTGITLNRNEMTMARGASEKLTATVQPAGADAEVTWTTSDRSVATVAPDGTVLAVGKGEAVITAEAGGKRTTCKVNVNVPLKSISIKQEDGITTLKKGDSTTLTVEYNPEDTTDAKDVVWKTSSEAIATVDANGTVTAIADGTATITATVGSLQATYDITVQEVKLTGISLNKKAATIHRGDSTQLKVTYEPDNTTDDRTVSWKSSDSSKVTVDGNGNVTAVAVGSANITATVGNFTAICTVTVDAPLEQILPNPATISLIKGQSTVLKHTLVPADTTDSKDISYSSSDVAVATIDAANGTVTAIAAGNATITLTGANGITAEVPVTVTEIPINEVVLDKVRAVVEKGKSIDLTAKVKPEDSTDDDKTIKWSVEDDKVATVNKTTTNAGESVTVTAVAGGTTTITAEAWNGKTATCEITVPIHLESIELVALDEPILRGQTTTLGVKYNPENMTDDVTLAWESSNPAVATVNSATGTITAEAEGETEITVTATTKEKATVTATTTIKVEEKHLTADNVKELEEILQSNLNELNKNQSIETDEVLSRDYIFSELGVTDTISFEWGIDNEDVLTFDKGGFLALKEGKTKVTLIIRAVDGSGKEVIFDPISTEVNVKEIPLEGIAFDKVIKEMKVGEVQTLGILYNPADTTDEKDVVWTSSDDTVLSVKDGKLTALKAGVAEITAKVGEKSVSCKITVKENTAGTGKGDAATTDKSTGNGKSGNVKTGDAANIALYVLTMLLAFSTVLVIIRKRIRR